MGWVRIDDSFYDHPKFADVTPLSISLWIVGMAYCNRNLTDGYIPESVANRLLDFDGLSYTVATIGELAAIGESDCTPLAVWDLIRVGLWHDEVHTCPSCPQPGRKRLYVHDYLSYQPSAEEIKRNSEVRSIAGKKGASARWAGKPDSKPDSKSHSSELCDSDGKSMPQPQPQPQEKPSARKRATDPPDLMPITGAMELWATDHAPNVDLGYETAKMLDWYRSHGRKMVNWHATWQNWMRKQQRDTEVQSRPQQLQRRSDIDKMFG
jgi:hypothetical protein